jgi:O-antigen ligase
VAVATATLEAGSPAGALAGVDEDTDRRRVLWDRPWGRALLVLFVLAHAQDVAAILAPASLLPLAALSIVRRPRGVHPIRLLTGATLAYFVAVSLLNGTLVGIGAVDFVRAYGAGLYSLAIFVVFLRLASRDRSLVPQLLRTGLLVTAGLAALYLFARFVHPLSVLGADLARDGNLLGFLGAHNPTAAQLGVFAIVGLVAGLAASGTAGGVLDAARAEVARAGVARPATWLPPATGLCLVAMLAARSRGYTLGLVVAVAYVLWTWRRSIPRTWTLPLRGILALGLLVVGFWLVGSRFDSPLADDPNVITRFALWERAADLAERSPLTGLGLGSFQQHDIDTDAVLPGLVAVRVQGAYLPHQIALDAEGGLHSHNVYLQLLAEVGLVGLVLYLWPLVGAWRRSRARGGAIDGTLRALFVYLAVAGLTAGLTMTSPTVSWPLFAAAAHVLTRREPSVGSGPR